MRVKLSYTADVDDVMFEASLLLGNMGTKLQEVIDLFNATVENLQEEKFNLNEFNESIDAIRHNLERIDTRCLEVEQVVVGFNSYQMEQRTPIVRVNDEDAQEDLSSEVATDHD